MTQWPDDSILSLVTGQCFVRGGLVLCREM